MSAPDDRERDDRREALLDQLGYLLAEAEALAPLLASLPPGVLTANLPGERSVLATLAHLAALDRDVHLPRLHRIVAEDVSHSNANTDPDGTVRDTLDVALADVREARTALLDAFEQIPLDEWSHTGTLTDGDPLDVAGLAFAVMQRDAAELSRVAYRLHESRLTDRAVDLPK